MIPTFSFHQQLYTDLDKLVNAMGIHWKDGEQALFSGQLRQHVSKSDPAFSASCAAAEKEAREKPDEVNRIYLRWLCRYKGITELYWKGRRLGGQKEISSALLRREEIVQKLVLYMTYSQFFSVFLQNIGCSEALTANVRFVEKACNRTESQFKRSNALPILEVLLAEDSSFVFAGETFNTPVELASHLQRYADQSKAALSRAIQPLFQNDFNLDPRFEAWIIQHGYHHELMLWKGRFQEGQGAIKETDVFCFEEDQELYTEAGQEGEADFAGNLDGFEKTFTRMLRQYADRIDDPVAFNGLMSDFFPTQRLQCHLLMTLYRMDIVKAIREAESLTEMTTARFQRRLVQDFGTKEVFARWAVYQWCHCYGEQVLHKPCTLEPQSFALLPEKMEDAAQAPSDP